MSLAPAAVAAPKPKKQREESDWRKNFRKENIVSTLFAGYIPMLIAIVVIFFPLVWMVFSSFKPSNEVITDHLVFFPENPTAQNYVQVAERVPLLALFKNSLIVTAVGASVKVFLAVTTAYALVFIDVPFRNAFFMGILVALMVPAEAAMIPNYMTIASLGGRNTLWGIILPTLGTAFGTFLLRQQYKTIPKGLLEAAELDGAGHWRRLWQMVVPVSAPTIATVALVTVVSEWNAFLWPLVITDTPDRMTLPVGLNLLQSVEGKVGSYGVLMAGAVLVITPVLILFIFLQRNIVAGLTQGAVK